MDTAIKERIDKQLGSNLRRGPGNPAWKRGMPSPNPNGRALKPFCMSDALRELQVGIPSEVIAKWKKKGELTGAQRSAFAMQKEIDKGNVQAFNQVADRVEGKVKETHDVNMEANLSVSDARISDQELIAIINRGGQGIVAPKASAN